MDNGNITALSADGVIKIIDHLKDIVTPIGIKLYMIYYTQVMYQGIMNCVMDIGGVIILPILAYKSWKKFELVHKDADYEDMGPMIWVIISIFLSVVALLTTINFMTSFPTDVMHVVNPDYYIINALLSGGKI
jgi:hypothetical protein